VSERLRVDHRSVTTLKATVQRFAFVGFAMTAVGLLVLGKADPLMMERTRAAIADSVAPLLAVLVRPVAAFTDGAEEIRRWMHLHEENARLRQEGDRLRQWQAVSLRLEAENEMLRQLLAFVPDPEVRYVSARVIADSGGTFANSVLVSGGAAHGIATGDAAMTGDGLAGRVVSVAAHSARILLITDLNSRIPVRIMPSRTRAILAGDNSESPRLLHLTPDSPIEPGQRIVTSADAGAFPAGLPVGMVASVEDGLIRVKPHAQRSRLDAVRIVDFGLDGIVGSRGSREGQAGARAEGEAQGQAEGQAQGRAEGQAMGGVDDAPERAPGG
jgi:rod shape-determining protein MreC